MNEALTISTLAERLARRERELLAVHRISAALQANTGLDDFLQQALLAAVETLDAGAGAVLLHDAESDRLVFRYVHDPPGKIGPLLTGRAIPVDQGVSGVVFRTGRGAVTPNAEADPHHFQFDDLAALYETQDLLTAPLKTSEGRPIGVIQLLNRRKGQFDSEDLKTLEILGSQAAAGIEAARLHETILNWEVDKRRFACEVLRCVTGGKLRLVEPEEFPHEGERVASISLTEPGAYGRMRQELLRLAEQVGMDPDLATDLVLAASEAATNTMKHGEAGQADLLRTRDRLVVEIRDRGPGIRPPDLPRVLFQAGFSTKVSLGMGYTLMLELADCIWLATSPEGTHLRLEKRLHPPPPREPDLAEVLERFSRPSCS